MRQFLLPVKVVDSNKAENEKALFKPKGLLGFHDYDPKKWSKYTKLDGLGSYIVLDFGKEMCGGVRILTSGIYNANTKIRIRFGESLGEVNSSIGEKNSCNAHGNRDFETVLCSSGDECYGNSGFRYVRIDILEDKFVYLRNVYCINNILSKKQIYNYSGNDERIKDIFDTAKRTVDLCSSSGYIWDGVKRDRLVWVGDMAPEVMALSTLYGPIKEIERSLDVTKKMFPLPEFMNGIATYSMWWVIIACDYYQEFKNEKYIKKHLNYIVKAIDNLGTIIDEKGNFNPNVRYIVDWPTVGTEDEDTGIRSIFLLALNKAKELLSEFGYVTKNIDDIKSRLLLKPLEVKKMKQVTALKYFATGKLSDEDYNLLIKGGEDGFSTFMSYYILTAIASRDEKLAIKLMKNYYGAMIDKGATTFWEDFEMKWVEDSGRIDEINPNLKDIHGDYGKHCYVGFRHSLCHGWSAGVIKFIKEQC